jgi:hypothetical protein
MEPHGTPQQTDDHKVTVSFIPTLGFSSFKNALNHVIILLSIPYACD